MQWTAKDLISNHLKVKKQRQDHRKKDIERKLRCIESTFGWIMLKISNAYNKNEL